jgi:hypothetical protein
MTLPPLYRGHNPALQMDKVELREKRVATHALCPGDCLEIG